MDINERTPAMKLASIFLPYASKRRENMIAQNGRFVHYTSAGNAIKIIQTRKLWMRNARCMNDYMEVSHGHELLLKFFQDNDRKDSFYRALEPCGNEIARKSLELFDQWWGKIQYNTFICSISEHDPDENKHGRLSMWRAYGQLSAKAAIVFNVPFQPEDATTGLSIMLSPVAYYSYEDVEKELTEVINNIKNNMNFLLSLESQIIIGHIFAMLVSATISLKHEGFKEEREWRVIYLPDLKASELMSRSIETVNGVPQNIYSIPLEENPTKKVVGISIPQLVERVILGPSEYSLPLREAFKVALEEAGVEDAESRVVVSGIPIRT